MTIRPAAPSEIAAIATLVNGAYRGASARAGWTHEADLLDGQRTDAAMIARLLDAVPGTILVLADADDAGLAGCVAIAPTSDAAVWTVGMLTVAPGLQAGGLGRRLLSAAEDYASAHGAQTIAMTVIDVRHALIAYYQRRGYQLTGAKAPFPYGDARVGHPLRTDLVFVAMEKIMIGRDGASR
jgi:GNAT superfamily N-acetyltransferase